jgi:hypothetical protein
LVIGNQLAQVLAKKDRGPGDGEAEGDQQRPEAEHGGMPRAAHAFGERRPASTEDAAEAHRDGLAPPGVPAPDLSANTTSRF